MLIKGKYPYKNKDEILKILEHKIEGYLSEEETHEIVVYMYSPSDSEVILNMLRKFMISGNPNIIKE